MSDQCSECGSMEVYGLFCLDCGASVLDIGSSLEAEESDEWFIRDNEEIDEKLPLLAMDVIRQGIDYEPETQGDDDIADMVQIMQKHLHTFGDMTFDEIMSLIEKLSIASGIADLVSEGIIKSEPDGILRLLEGTESNNEKDNSSSL